MTASVDSTTTAAAAARPGAPAPDAPLRPKRIAQLELQDKVSLTEEGRRRVMSEAGPATTQVARSDADLFQLLRQRGQALRAGPDLSKEAGVLPLTDPNTGALKSVLWSSDISDEDLGRINGAIDAATPVASRLSNDPALELTLRKMKLDYIRDALVPEGLHAQADQAIAGYVSGTRLDADRISMRLTQYAIQQSAASGPAGESQRQAVELKAWASGTAAPQQRTSELLGLVADNHYRTRQEASASFEQSITDIQSAMLARVASWPRDQDRGRAEVYTRIAAIRSDWTRFVESWG
jgi:hypothetical protein